MKRLIYARHPLRWPGKRPRCWLPPFRKYEWWVRYRGSQILLTWVPFQGICVTALWLPGDNLLAFPPERQRWERIRMKKKTSSSPAGTERHLADMQTALLKGHLPILEHCAFRQYDDGDPRDPGWVTIGTNGSAWVVTVKDPDACVSFKVVGATIDQALDTAALHLACDEAPWEHDRFLEDAKKKKKK